MSTASDSLAGNVAVDPIPWLEETDGERRDKFLVEIGSDKYDKSSPLYVTLRMRLDEREPAEREVIETFETDAENRFVFSYALKNTVINLEEERKDFTTHMEQIYQQTGVGPLLKSDTLQKLTDEHLRKLLAPLAQQGDSLFKRLFFYPQVTHVSHNESDLELIRPALRSVLNRPQAVSITSSEPLLPWAFLYDDPNFNPDDHSTIAPGSFWGFRHEIQQDLGCTAKRTKLPPNPTMLTAIDPHEDGGRHKATSHTFSQLKARSVTTRDELAAALEDFRNDVFYFFGHASDADQPYKSWLKLQDVDLRVSQLSDLNAPRFNNVPVLAFLNGCRTGPLRRWDENTVVGYLCLKEPTRRVCCVATLAEVPGAFAVEFASHVWKCFWLDKEPLGSALLEARKKMLGTWNNPLGLLYCLFGCVDTRIHKEAKGVKKDA